MALEFHGTLSAYRDIYRQMFIQVLVKFIYYVANWVIHVTANDKKPPPAAGRCKSCARLVLERGARCTAAALIKEAAQVREIHLWLDFCRHIDVLIHSDISFHVKKGGEDNVAGSIIASAL